MSNKELVHVLFALPGPALALSLLSQNPVEHSRLEADLYRILAFLISASVFHFFYFRLFSGLSPFRWTELLIYNLTSLNLALLALIAFSLLCAPFGIPILIFGVPSCFLLAATVRTWRLRS